MPDVYFQSASLMAMPFLGRLLRVMPGTSFFSMKSGAPIVPVYPYPAEKFGMRITIGEAVCPDSPDFDKYRVDDDSLSFALTRTYFHDFENVLSADPHHWNYWDTILQRSTVFRSCYEASGDSPEMLVFEPERLAGALAPRFKQDPELESRFSDFHFDIKSRLSE